MPDSLVSPLVTLQLQAHPHNFWQIPLQGYAIGKAVSKRAFGAVLSTSLGQLLVPPTDFAAIMKAYGAVKKNALVDYKVDCQRTVDGPSLYLDLGGKRLELNSRVLTQGYPGGEECLLLVRPSIHGLQWVIGTVLTEAAATCYNAERQQVEFYTHKKPARAARAGLAAQMHAAAAELGWNKTVHGSHTDYLIH